MNIVKPSAVAPASCRLFLITLLACCCTGGALRLQARPAGSDTSAANLATTAAHEAAKGDTLLEALLTELDRSKAQLKMDQVQAPY